MQGLPSPPPTHTGPPSRIHSRPFAKPVSTISRMDGSSPGSSMDQDDTGQTGTGCRREAEIGTETPSEEALLPSPQRARRSVGRPDGRIKWLHQSRPNRRALPRLPQDRNQPPPPVLGRHRKPLDAVAAPLHHAPHLEWHRPIPLE